MTAPQVHIIKRQIFELELESGLDHAEIEHHLSVLNREHLHAAIERVCNSIVPPDTVLQIDSLELELPQLHASQLTTEWVPTFEKRLREQLTKHLVQAVHRPAFYPVKEQPATARQGDLLAHYLQTGNMPWWAPAATRSAALKTFEAQLPTLSAAQKKQLAVLLNNPAVRQRASRQFSESALKKLVATLAKTSPSTGTPAVATLLQWQQALKKFLVAAQVLSSYAAWPEVLWETTLAAVARDGKLKKREHYVYALLTALALRYPRHAQALLQAAETAQVAVSGPLKKELKAQAARVRADRSPATSGDQSPLSAKSGNESPSPDNAGATAADAAKQPQAPPTAGKKPRQQRGQGPAEPPATQSASGKAEEAKPQPQNQAPAEQQHSKSVASSENAQPEQPSQLTPQSESWKRYLRLQWGQSPWEGEEIFIQNAGIVLLWPYLPRFFQFQGLAGEDGFNSEDDAMQAVHMLQYIGTGAAHDPEFECALSKLMCGLDLLDPLSHNMKLSSKQKSDCDNLLTAVIRNWDALGNASVIGFRGAWLLREGRLADSDSGWVLRVEQKTWDILMKKLPWSYNIVRLKWMERPIYVEW